MSKKTVEERFWSKVDIRGDDECWEWTAGRNRGGYGRFRNGRHQPAHRYSWELHNKKEIPEGLLVMHSCDNPPCVNPKHLVVGTHRDNTIDALRKKRLPNLFGKGKDNPMWGKRHSDEWRKEHSKRMMGEGNSNAKLTSKEKTRMVEIHKEGLYSIPYIGRMFDVSRHWAWSIISGKHRWEEENDE